MKSRQRFVSNSSSSSFICYWRSLKGNDLKLALYELFELYPEDHLCKKADDIIKHTDVTNSEGTFKTSYFIPMYNSNFDIPEELAYLVAAINLEAGYELIDLISEGN